MKNKKVILIIIAVIVLAVITGGIVGTGLYNKSEAKKSLNKYLTFIKDGNYSNAYEMLSEVDKDIISQDLFLKWRNTVAKGIKNNGFKISSKIDSFSNYMYNGKVYKKAYGLKVDNEQEILKNTFKPTDYDEKTIRIMVGKENRDYKIMLFLKDLPERIRAYEIQLK